MATAAFDCLPWREYWLVRLPVMVSGRLWLSLSADQKAMAILTLLVLSTLGWLYFAKGAPHYLLELCG
jgi:hypothetical protein